MADGREGDWECSGCQNRNYAFRSFCNRCKQPRLLVDIKTRPDSKWLPRIGDWICSGCTNNNYASREKCKKCGQPKEIAAMPAIAMPGASLPTYSHYFARIQGGPEQKINAGFVGNGLLQPIPLGSNWSMAGDKYGVQSASTWPLGGNYGAGLTSPHPADQALSVPKGWRNGDWICSCGFHNYSSRAQCKKCDASMPPALGTKRLASEEFVNDWDNKRLNAGHLHNHFMNVLPIGQQPYPGYEQMVAPSLDPKIRLFSTYPSMSTGLPPNLPVPMQFPHHATPPTLLGKGAKQWRDGDWMCTNCSNHNYASRSQCNRCKTQRDGIAQSTSAVSGKKL